MEWDPNDLGTYTIQVEHRGWCDVVMVSFLILLHSIQGTVGSTTTTWKDPYPDVPLEGSCYYSQFACSSGTPTCTEGYSFNFSGQTCPYFWRVNFLTYRRFFTTFWSGPQN